MPPLAAIKTTKVIKRSPSKNDRNIRLMIDEDKDQVVALFIEIFKREPLCSNYDKMEELGRKIVAEAVKNPASFVVEDLSLEGPNRIVAFSANSLNQGYEEFLGREKEDVVESSNDPVLSIVDSIQRLWGERSKVLKANPKAKILEIIALGVHQRYGKSGICKELGFACLTRALELNCDAITSIATAGTTQRIAEQISTEVVRIRYSDFEWMNPKSGRMERPFEGITWPEYAKMFEMSLKDSFIRVWIAKAYKKWKSLWKKTKA